MPLLRRLESAVPTSSVWLTPDLTLGFHHFDYRNGEYDGFSHTHAEYGVVMCLAGSLEILYPDRIDVIRTGEVTIVNPGDMHRCRFGVDGQHSCGLTLIVRPAVMQSVVDVMALPYPSPDRGLRFLGKFNNPDVFDLAGRLLNEFREQRRGVGTMVETMVRQILVYLLRDWPSEAVTPLSSHLLPQLPWLHMHRATEYMNCHGKGAFRLSDLCDHVGVSSSRFIPLFKNSSGISPHVYYNSLIVFKARRLLLAERLSTKEAAYALGFKNVSHFCSLFLQVTGTTPKGFIEAPPHSID